MNEEEKKKKEDGGLKMNRSKKEKWKIKTEF